MMIPPEEWNQKSDQRSAEKKDGYCWNCYGEELEMRAPRFWLINVLNISFSNSVCQ
jgi:hypothetical protein